LKEVVKGETALDKQAMDARVIISQIRDELDATSDPYMSGQPLDWMYKDADGKPRRVPYSYHAKLDEASLAIRNYEDYQNPDDFSGQSTSIGGPKFAAYQLPGGSNYREMLLTLPGKEPVLPPKPELLLKLPEGYDPIHDSHADPSRAWGVTPPGQTHARFMGGAHPTKEAALKEALALVNNERLASWANDVEKAKKDVGGYRSSHWDEPNVLAHVRMNDRVDAQGKKVLFIEEVQSDWGQSLKKQRDQVYKAIDSDFDNIVKKMEKDGILKVKC
jgi:hypothetical protein